jgi:folate-dependent phosphoribosylglycinamide formyltransferase PurN
MSAPLDRPIRVVQFSGAYLDAPALRFALMLEQDPGIELVGVLCQAPAGGRRLRLAELWRRRGILSVVVALRSLTSAALRFLCAPREFVAARAQAAKLESKVVIAADVHSPDVLEQVRSWRPDLGAVYGAPVLRPVLFEIPALGTFGIHHGRVPDYRGKKTTFWEIYNGERVAGVTIQRIDAGIDRGDVIKAGEVEIGTKCYGRVESETQDLGYQLYVAAILEVRQGVAQYHAQARTPGRHFRQPSAADFVRLWLRVARRRLGMRVP